RVLVFIQWAIQDLTFARGARLITGGTPSDFFLGDGGASGARVPDGGPRPGAVVAAAAVPHAEERTHRRGTSPPKPTGRLPVLGLIAIGAAPVLAFSAWLPTVVGRTMPLPGGGNIPNVLAPVSGHAKALFDLGMFVFAVTGVIFAIVFGLLVTAITRFRRIA